MLEEIKKTAAWIKAQTHDFTPEVGIILGTMVAGGILISLLFTFFAVNKFVNMKTNKIYLY